ncbi:MAG: sensor histidine kinase [Syntrophobacteraceae bacterium]
MESSAVSPDTLFAPAERAPEALVQLQSKMIIDTANLDKLLGAVTDMVIILNRERQIVFANERFLEAVRTWGIESVLGLRPGEALKCVHAAELEGGCGTSESCGTCGAVRAILTAQRGFENVQECRIVQEESGDAFDLLFRSSPLTIGNDRFTLEAIRDISHEKRRRMLERLFFHDVMNTAVGVRGLSELLNLAGEEELDVFRQMIHSGAALLVDEIRAQRDFTAAENNELKCKVGPVNAAEVLRQLADLYRSQETARGKTLRLSNRMESVELQSDKVLLMRILGNMLKNALEACAEGDTVTMGCQRHGPDRIRFWVHNPVYVPRDVQLQIFQRSFSTKGTGRGLGTYSMKLLSERYLKGNVFFESTEELGTLFSAVYPLIWEQDENPATAEIIRN